MGHRQPNAAHAATEGGADVNTTNPNDDRKEEAAIVKAEAEAAKATADAQKAAADAEKAKADARAAEATARKAEQDVEDHDAPAAGRQREAEASKKAAEAAKDAAAARREQLAALIPDLSGVKESTLEVKEGPQMWGTFLLGRALHAAASAVAAKLTPALADGWRVLVTSEADLASGDAVYQDVKTGLAEIVTAADKLLEDTTPESVATAAFTPIDAIGALASAVPAVLSLLSARRTVNTSAVTASDLAAAAEVSGVLKAAAAAATVVHDDFRVVPGGGVYTLAGNVSLKRQQLIGRKIELGDKKIRLEPDLAEAKTDADSLEKAARPEQARELDDALKKVYALERQLAEIELRAGLVDALVTAIDAFTTAIRAVPHGSHRSPLASAALHEELHAGSPHFTHVLLVKTQPGVAQQMLEDRPLWWEDKFSTAVDASITYMLIETSNSGIVAAGTETAIQSAHGKIGGRPTIEAE